MSLEDKVTQSREVIKEALQKARSPFVVFTGGKDSLTVLSLVRSVLGGEVTIPVLQVDTGANFKEVTLFVEKMRRLWGFELYRELNEKAIKNIEIAKDKIECCRLLKTEVLNRTIEKYKIDYLFTGARHGEQNFQGDKEFFVPKKNHIQVNPVTYFTEKDIWNYIRGKSLPYCSLYDKGYRSLGCIPCTVVHSEGEVSKESLEEELVKEKLRGLGYL